MPPRIGEIALVPPRNGPARAITPEDERPPVIESTASTGSGGPLASNRGRPVKPWLDGATAEAFLADYFDTYGVRGAGRLRTMAAHPAGLVRAWRAISRLPILDAALCTSDEAQLVRQGLLRTKKIARALVRGTTAVLQIPEEGDSYLLGSNESKRSLRTKVRRAERCGFTTSSPSSRDERFELLRLSDAFERAHPDPIYRNTSPRTEYLADIRTWLVARDATGKPLLVAVVPFDGDWGVLEYFKTLENSDDARLARHWLSAMLVQHLSDLGVRYLADVSGPVGLPTGLRSFQRRLGYRLVRVRVSSRPERASAVVKSRLDRARPSSARPVGFPRVEHRADEARRG
jgi:hypothetical protein